MAITGGEAVAGSSSFSFRSGHVALDLAATLMFREALRKPRELLTSRTALARWIRASGLVDSTPRVSADDLAAAVALREAVYRAALAAHSGRDLASEDRRLLNRLAAAPPPVIELEEVGRARQRGDARAVLALVARSAIELLGGPDLGRLRQCGRNGCTRFFLDHSRGGNRVWCGMRECGNRVNAAHYRQRHRLTEARRGQRGSPRGRAGGR